MKRFLTSYAAFHRCYRLLLIAVMLLGTYSIAWGQNQVITGTVLSATDDEPLIGATLSVRSTGNGTTTDVSGSFKLTAPVGAILDVSFIGYLKSEVKVTRDRNFYKIKLSEDSELLEEVVVVGYGVQKKKLTTGATLQVKGDDLQNLSTTNPLAAMQSKSPGLTITQNNGLPDGGYTMNIRGLGTVGDAAPLIIIDGIVGGDLNALNPADIESIDVLKDAASAAIYGSRAANGVILVTTRQGKAGKTVVTLDAYFGIQNVQKMAKPLDALTYAELQNEARMNDGLAPYDFAALVPKWADIQNGTFKGTNWLDEFRNRNATLQSYALNITGGNDQSVYSVGLSYTSQEAIFGHPVDPKYDRYTLRANSEKTILRLKGKDIIKFGENILYTFNEKNNNNIGVGNIYGNDVNSMIKTSPFNTLMNDGNTDYSYSIPWNSDEANPIGYYSYNRSNSINRSHNLRLNAYISVHPFQGFTFKSNFGYGYSSNTSRSYNPKYKLAPKVYRIEDTVSNSMSSGYNWLWENTINYKFSISKHNFDILMGQSAEKSGMGMSINGSNVNPIFNDLEHAYLTNTKDIVVGKTSLSSSPWGMNRIASFFGRINYDYKETYMLSVIMRADGSSNFGPDSRWGYFPSVSAGWVMTNESFMEPTSSFLDFLKLRASWGQNGNQAISPFQYLSTIQVGGYQANYYFGTDSNTISTGSYPNIIPNKNIGWETSEQFNIGLDSRFFQQRLGFTFDYYIKTTKDWLVRAPVLGSYGTGAPYINGGDVRNTGFEVALDWRDNINEFTYGIQGNLAYNKNKVLRIANKEGIINGQSNVISEGTGELYRAEVGRPIGFFYGYKTAGIFQTQEEIDGYKGAKLAGTRPGDVIFVDRDKDGFITQQDRTMIGNPHPDFTFGFSVTAGYKGFDLSITTNGTLGNQITKSYRSFADSPKQNWTEEILGRWHGPGTSNKIPKLTAGTNNSWQYISDLYIQNGDFWRCQNITLGYDFKKLLKSSIPLSQARLYISAQNLFTVTSYDGMDPEIGYGAGDSWARGIDLGFYPAPRTFLIGANIKF